MDGDPDHDIKYLQTKDAILIPGVLCKKLTNMLSAESTLISVEKDDDTNIITKSHLLPNPIEYYREMNRILQKVYKNHDQLDKYREYKQNCHIYNCIHIFRYNGNYYLNLEKKSAQGFLDIINNHPLEV